MQFLQYNASLPRGSGPCNLCNALPHCPGEVGSGTPAMHCLTSLRQWAVEVEQYTSSLPGAAGSATTAVHCLTTWGQRVVQLLQCIASLPGGSR